MNKQGGTLELLLYCDTHKCMKKITDNYSGIILYLYDTSMNDNKEKNKSFWNNKKRTTGPKS